MSRPLTDAEVVSTVQLLDFVPASITEPAATVVRRALEILKRREIAAGGLAVWPDGTWVILGHNPDWSHPRHSQLIRAYRSAYLVGIRIPIAHTPSGGI